MSLIKIHMSNFCKRIDEKFQLEQNFGNKAKKSINLNINNIPHIDSPKSTSTNNLLFPIKSRVSRPKQPPYAVEGEDFNKGLASESSSSLSNIFKGNSIKYIRILGVILFILTFLLITIMFLIMYFHLNEIKEKIEFLRNGYLILNYILYIKLFATEGVLARTLPSYYPSKVLGGIGPFLNIIKQELSFYRQQLTETYDFFETKELSQKYKDFMKNTKITIDTLTVNKPEKITIMFNSAISRISASINDLAADDTLLNIENRNAYELMYNLINEYYIKWENVTTILFNDSNNSTNLKMSIMFIVVSYIVLSLIIFLIFLKLLSKFSLEREKPINLFLTMKKAVFENLKNCAENFSNQILNKFFGIEDNEEESQQDYQANIHPNDINIAKFKAANEFNSSIIRAFSFANMIIIIGVFILLNLLYLIFSYLDFRKRMEKIFYFIYLYDKNNYSQSKFILSVNIFKSFLFNRSIPILNSENSEKIFFENFLNLTEKFDYSLAYITKTKSFLKGIYLEKYEQYFYGNFSELLDQEYYINKLKSRDNYVKYGIKALETIICEEIRYLIMKYCILPEENRRDGISKILSDREVKLADILIIIQHIVRDWYNGNLELMINSFYNFQSFIKFAYAIIFICLIIILILYYSIVWKTYEEKLNILLKGSADLINLIPQEIKNIIIEKLKE